MKKAKTTLRDVTDMDTEEKTKPARTVERGPRSKGKDSHVVFFFLPVVLTILFPVGGIFYLCGRFSPGPLTFMHVNILYLATMGFILYCFFLGIVKLSGRRRKRTRKERLLIAAETVIPLIFFGVLVSNFFFVGPRFFGRRQKLFMLGLRDRVKSRADIGATRTWLQSLGDKDYDYASDHYTGISRADLPESLKGLRDAGASLSADENGKAKVRLIWGSGMLGHWGAEIGMKDMKIPPSDFNPYGEVRLPLEPGVYVWWALE